MADLKEIEPSILWIDEQTIDISADTHEAVKEYAHQLLPVISWLESKPIPTCCTHEWRQKQYEAQQQRKLQSESDRKLTSIDHKHQIDLALRRCLSVAMQEPRNRQKSGEINAIRRQIVDRVNCTMTPRLAIEQFHMELMQLHSSLSESECTIGGETNDADEGLGG